jgi:hypothetical protein
VCAPLGKKQVANAVRQALGPPACREQALQCEWRGRANSSSRLLKNSFAVAVVA